MHAAALYQSAADHYSSCTIYFSTVSGSYTDTGTQLHDLFSTAKGSYTSTGTGTQVYKYRTLASCQSTDSSNRSKPLNLGTTGPGCNSHLSDAQ